MNRMRLAWLKRFSELQDPKVFFCSPSFATSVESTPGGEGTPTQQGEMKNSHLSPRLLLIHRTNMPCLPGGRDSVSFDTALPSALGNWNGFF